jgi:hypothetical protein
VLKERLLIDRRGSEECRRLKKRDVLAFRRARRSVVFDKAAVAHADNISLTESCSEALLCRGKL